MPEVIILDSKPILDSLAVSLPYYEFSVRAGQSRFPSPAQDFVVGDLKLDERLITNPPSTVLTRATGDSMTGVGIYPGSILVVNKALKPKSSSIVIAVVDGELLVKRLYKHGGVVKLLSENPAYDPIEFKEGQELIIWGVVTYVITAPQ
jgi:DNA polymerase V